MRTQKQIFLYGIGGPEKQFAVLGFYFLDETELSIDRLVYEAAMLRMRNPSIAEVYAIDNRPGLKRDYAESVKLNTIESCAIFKDILVREGIKIL